MIKGFLLALLCIFLLHAAHLLLILNLPVGGHGRETSKHDEMEKCLADTTTLKMT